MLDPFWVFSPKMSCFPSLSLIALVLIVAFFWANKTGLMTKWVKNPNRVLLEIGGWSRLKFAHRPDSVVRHAEYLPSASSGPMLIPKSFTRSLNSS